MKEILYVSLWIVPLKASVWSELHISVILFEGIKLFLVRAFVIIGRVLSF